MRELRMNPDKWEMVKAFGEWVKEKADVEYATFDGINRLTVFDLKLIMLAIGYKLDQREVASLRRYFQNQWEYRNGKKANIVNSTAIEFDPNA